MIFPIDDNPINADKKKMYQNFLTSAQDQYDFFNSHRRKNGTIDPSQHYERRYIRTNNKDDNRRPAWGQGGRDGSNSTERVSKYKSNSLIKARVDTGLSSLAKKNQCVMSSRSIGITGAIEEEKDIDNLSSSSKEIYLRDLLDP